MLQLLLQAKADPLQCGGDGRNSIDIAKERCSGVDANPELALLLELVPDAIAEPSNGQTRGQR